MNDKLNNKKDFSNVVDWEALASFFNEMIKLDEPKEILGSFGPKSKKDRELAKNTLLIAHKDFETSKLLYSSHDLPNAALYLQKAVEKLAKGFAGEELPLNEGEIHKTSHNTPLIFLKLLQVPAIDRFLREFKKVVPTIDIAKLDKLQELIKDVKSLPSKQQMARLPASFISDFLDICDIMMSFEDKIADIDSLNKISVRDLESMLRANLTRVLKDNPELAAETEKIDLRSLVSDTLSTEHNQLIALLILPVPIFILSVITYPHKAFTEYADGEMKPFDYTEDLGVLQSFDRIHEIGLKICMKLIEIYEAKG
ncbi:MAG: hypothetical protein ACYCR7_04625 [Thermoplasmataceae archaeon]